MIPADPKPDGCYWIHLGLDSATVANLKLIEAVHWHDKDNKNPGLAKVAHYVLRIGLLHREDLSQKFEAFVRYRDAEGFEGDSQLLTAMLSKAAEPKRKRSRSAR